MEKLYGWIIYNGNLVTDKFMDYVTWFQNAASKENIVVEAIPNNSLLVTIERVDKKEMDHTSLAGIPRNRWPDFVHFADKDLHLARQLESLGIPVFNSSKAIELCDNKASMYQAMSAENIVIPKTIIAPKIYEGIPIQDTTHLDLVMNEIGLPLIIKEAYGSFGKQVYWINNRDELYSMAQRLKGKEYIFQKPVMTSLGMDIRLNVVGDKVIVAMKRTSQNDFRANVSAGGKTETYQPTEAEIHLAVSTAKAVGASFAGVDLLFGEDGPILCEINSNPHLRSIYECTGVDVAVEMIRYIRKSVLNFSIKRKVDCNE